MDHHKKIEFQLANPDLMLDDYESFQTWLSVEKEAQMIERKYSGGGKEKNNEISNLEKGIKNRQRQIKRDLNKNSDRPPNTKVFSKPPVLKSREGPSLRKKPKKEVLRDSMNRSVKSKLGTPRSKRADYKVLQIVDLQMKIKPEDIEKNLDQLRNHQSDLKKEMVKMNLKNSGGVLEYMLKRANQKVTEEAFYTMVNIFYQDKVFQKRVEAFRRQNLTKKIILSLKFNIMDNINQKKMALHKMMKERDTRNTRIAVDFREFSLKAKVFEAIGIILEEIEDQKLNIHELGLVGAKVGDFRETIQSLKAKKQLLMSQSNTNEDNRTEFDDFSSNMTDSEIRDFTVQGIATLPRPESFPIMEEVDDDSNYEDSNPRIGYGWGEAAENSVDQSLELERLRTVHLRIF